MNKVVIQGSELTIKVKTGYLEQLVNMWYNAASTPPSVPKEVITI